MGKTAYDIFREDLKRQRRLNVILHQLEKEFFALIRQHKNNISAKGAAR